MASSRNPRSADPAQAARQALASLKPLPKRIAAGLSGGMDSVVLLHVMRGLARESGFRLSAIHVNHGISPNARQWEGFCAKLCREWKIPLEVRRFRVRKGKAGPEAAAREARRLAFAGAKADAIALAHHLDDQAETVLHNLLRGTGLRGASGMPASGELETKRVLRPLLGVPKRAMAGYARKHELEWIEDESNADAALTRNFLRLEVAPLLETRFPRWKESLARAARHFAAEDLSRAELLRAFLAEQGLRAPSEARLAEMLKQIDGGGSMAIAHDGKVLRAFRGKVFLGESAAPAPFLPTAWRGESRLALPALGGELRFRKVRGEGIDLRRVKQGGFEVRLRTGGERLQSDPRRPRRTLKNLFQEAGVPVTVYDAQALDHDSVAKNIKPGDTTITPPLMGFLEECFATPAP